MDWALLRYAASRNLGDDIQSIAVRELLPRVNVFVDREALHSSAPASPVRIIFNGWFLHGFGEWPPADTLRPLVFGFHIARPSQILSPAGVDYLRQFQPLGCRDLFTVAACREQGLDAYWSGCLTLTLPLGNVPRTERIYLVDVDPELEYEAIPADLRRVALYRTHRVPPRWQTDHAWKNARATELLDEYRTARLVITGRLHVALPCIAFGTPTLLVHPQIHTDPRFSGWADWIPHLDGSKPLPPGLLEQLLNEPPRPLPVEIVDMRTRIRQLILDTQSREQG